ncbi:hypothetical protein C8R44DRAFT_875588 [Mycena epipterygia]|nr:hypothetical protein C8R44DRAFT_875588 [Mycena epipterygia]
MALNHMRDSELSDSHLTRKLLLNADDAILGKQRYLAGDSLILAELFHIPYAPLLEKGGSDIMTQKPNVTR